jgi:ATP-dependent Clp protease protease subunit
MPKKKPVKKINTKKKIITDKFGAIDLDETLFHDRIIFLYESVSSHSMEEAIKQIKVLDMINHKPIEVHISSYGGSVDAGFAFIDVMKSLKSKIIMVVQGSVCSMGALISIAGDERRCYENSWFMFHDMAGGVGDYSAKMEARMEYMKKLYKSIETHIKKHTKLTQKDIDYSRDKELWIPANEAVKKGLTDEVIRN